MLLKIWFGLARTVISLEATREYSKGTLDICRDDLSVKLCPNCHNTHACVEWGTEGELTCFCLESIF